MPSKLQEIYWSSTYEDLRLKLKLRVGFEQAKVFQDFQSMALIMKKFFGTEEEEAKPPQDLNSARAALAMVTGG